MHVVKTKMKGMLPIGCGLGDSRGAPGGVGGIVRRVDTLVKYQITANLQCYVYTMFPIWLQHHMYITYVS